MLPTLRRCYSDLVQAQNKSQSPRAEESFDRGCAQETHGQSSSGLHRHRFLR